MHLSLEDKTSQRKEWPKGSCAGIPAEPGGWDGCTWRAERGRSTTSRRPDVWPWAGHANSLTLFLPDLFPKYLSDFFFCCFSFSPSIPPSITLCSSYSSGLFSCFLVSSSYFFLYLEDFCFLPVSKEPSQLVPSVSPKWSSPSLIIFSSSLIPPAFTRRDPTISTP